MKMDFMMIYALLIGGICIFLIINDLKLIKDFKALKAEKHLETYQVIDYSKSYILMYSVLGISAILLFFIGEQNNSMLLVDGIILIIAIFEAITCKYRFRVYYNDKEFIYENDVYRFKSISSIKKIKKRGRNYEIKTYNGLSISLTSNVAIKIEELFENSKKSK